MFAPLVCSTSSCPPSAVTPLNAIVQECGSTAASDCEREHTAVAAKCFASSWAAVELTTKPLQSRDVTGTLDAEFNATFADPVPDVNINAPTLRRAVGHIVEARLLAKFGGIYQSHATTTLTPAKRRLSDMDNSIQSTVAQAREKFLSTSVVYPPVDTQLSASAMQFVSQKLFEIEVKAASIAQDVCEIQTVFNSAENRTCPQ